MLDLEFTSDDEEVLEELHGGGRLDNPANLVHDDHQNNGVPTSE